VTAGVTMGDSDGGGTIAVGTATAAAAQWKVRRRHDHDVRHIDRGGRRRRRWATEAQLVAGRQGVRSRAGRWGKSIFSDNQRDNRNSTYYRNS
jgi:hypothetical protein